MNNLNTLLQAAAVGQAAVAFINLALIRLLHWKPDLEKMPLLMREVFHIHVWFISITLWIFAGLTWRFSLEMSAGQAPVFRWIAGSIGIFWLIRAFLQVAWYSSVHWKGQPGRILIHIILLLSYGGMGALYLMVALKGCHECIF